MNGTTVNASAISLAPLGSYDGATQTLIPLPGSPAICGGLVAGILSGLTTDQRGLPNSNAGYPNYSTCMDAGAVETNYALSFTTQPSGAALATDFNAAVTLTESGTPFQPAVTISLTLTGSGTLTGGSAATSGGVASYTLQVDTAGSSDRLMANPTLNGGLAPAVAISATSSSFAVGMATPTVTLGLSSASITYGTLETLTATVPSAATGTVTFYNNGSTVLGMGTVSGGDGDVLEFDADGRIVFDHGRLLRRQQLGL
ncbi:MAG: choice-of-anchor Q domain-containing protein [Terracidiphilus sp.]